MQVVKSNFMPLKIFREIVGAYKNSNAISLSTGSDQVCTYVHHVLACLCTTTSTVIFFQMLNSTGVCISVQEQPKWVKIISEGALLFSSICIFNKCYKHCIDDQCKSRVMKIITNSENISPHCVQCLLCSKLVFTDRQLLNFIAITNCYTVILKS